MKIEGEAVYVDLNGKRHSIEGVGRLPDDASLQSLSVSGSLSFVDFSCDKIKIDGEARGKSINAKNISIEGTFEGTTLKVDSSFKASGSVKIESISSKNIIIESRSGSILDVDCENIKVFHDETEFDGSIIAKLFGSKVSQNKRKSRVHIGKINAVEVELQNCEVEEIKCKNAHIGSNCMIQRLIVEGECKIAVDSKVVEMIRNDPVV